MVIRKLPKLQTVSGATGGDISQGTTYKNTGTSTATYYNIYSVLVK